MDEQFKIGDVVQLKSGGPSMTVSGKSGEQLACQWYTGAEYGYSTSYFAPETLRKAE